MTIDFPNSPSVNQTYSVNNVEWIWTGSVWNKIGEFGPTGPTGPSGPTGPTGAVGPTGPLVGGSTNQIIYKNASNEAAGSANLTFNGSDINLLGTITTRASATQDGIAISGRAGGTGDYEVKLIPTILTGDRVLTLPDETGFVATKTYVDSIASGINWHEACKYATAGVLPNSPTYSNGSSGVGATLTASSNARLNIDGANASTSNRVLVKNQSDSKQNGIYVVQEQGSVSTPWILVRAADADNSIAGQVKAGDAVFVTLGSVNANQGFVINSDGTGTNRAHILGTDDVTYTQFTGTATLLAGAGLNKSGNTIDIATADSGRIVVNADSIDLATVNQVNITESPTKTFIAAFTVDSYGRVTGKTTASIPDIALGADTSGDYVQSLVQGTGITITNNTGEGSTPTIAVTANTYQPLDGELTALAGTTAAADTVPYFTGANTAETTPLTSFARTLIDDTDAAAARSTLGLVIGTNVQAQDTELTAIASVTSAANALPYFTGSGTASTTTLSAFGRTLIDDADASTARTTLGLAIGTDIQPYDATLAAIASGTYTGATSITTVGTITTGTWNGSDIPLGTRTSGNYVATVSAGTGVSFSSGTGTGEGSSPTIAIGQAVATTDSPTFAGLTLTGDIAVNGGDITTTATGNATIFNTNASAVTIGGAASQVNIGGTAPTINLGSGTTGATVNVKGSLVVEGTTTTINSTTLSVDDKNIVLGADNTLDSAADGGGITLKGATDKTFNWVDATDAWTSSEHLNLIGKNFYINGVQVLGPTALGTNIVTSSLTSFGASPTITTPALTLSLTSSTAEGRIAWNATNDKIIVGDGSATQEFASSTVKFNERTASYTLAQTDKDLVIEMNVAGANTLTIPTNTNAPFPVGTQIMVVQTGAGQTTIAPFDGTVTVNGTPGLKLRAQWSGVTLIKRGTNSWVVTGDLSA